MSRLPKALAAGVLVVLALSIGRQALAGERTRIEVIEISGIIDGTVERNVIGAIEDAEDNNPELIVFQINSKGVVGDGRVNHIVDVMLESETPIATWIGPPDSRAENGAALIAMAGHITAMAPASSIGPIKTFDLSATATAPDVEKSKFAKRIGTDQAEDEEVIDIVAPALANLLEELDGKKIAKLDETLDIDTDASQIRFSKGDLIGRALHAAAQPSIVYLLLLLALVGIVFELFHPSTGPAGITGLLALALSIYGMVALGGSWFGFALIIIGVGFFAIDLRYQALGVATAVGFLALVGGSLLLFRSPFLHVNPWVLAFGIVSMVAFLIGAMTRVLRDLRALARGEMEVTDAHAHLEVDDQSGGSGELPDGKDH